MNKIQRIILIFLVIVPSVCLAQKNQERMRNLQRYPFPKAIHSIMSHWLGHRLPGSHIGIVIQSMRTGKTLYQRNANHLFTPASVQKLLTATAALDYLKPSFTFKTALLTNGKIEHHILKGDLIVKFSGDPEFTSDDFKKLVSQLHALGVRRITGHVYINASDYGNIPYPPGWIWDDLSYSFAAPLMTTIINRNYFILTLKPPLGNRKIPMITTNLPPGIIDLSNEITVVNHLSKSCPISIYSDANNHYRLRGCYYRRWKKQVRKIAIRNVPRYARVLLKTYLKSNNIIYLGPIRFKSTIKGLHPIAEHLSPSLEKIIKKMLKNSDNLMTNAVFKKIGETYFQTHGTWKNSLSALKQLLAKPTGIDFKTNLINDGAGLSRYNLITPRQVSKVLYFAYHNNIVKKPLMMALPIAGRDGTMADRLQDQQRDSRIRMKTGSMTGVTALAGYIQTRHIGNISLVIMVNGFVKPRKPFIGMEDDICRYLVGVR